MFYKLKCKKMLVFIGILSNGYEIIKNSFCENLDNFKSI